MGEGREKNQPFGYLLNCAKPNVSKISRKNSLTLEGDTDI